MGPDARDAEPLATTTLPFPTKCARCQRTYAAFRAKIVRWHRSVFPSPPNAAHHTHTALGTLCVSDTVRILARSFPKTVADLSRCRTKSPARLADLTEGLGVRVDTLETHGGMGRIYALRDPDKILKVADVKTSWSKYEAKNYQLLEARGVPVATVHAAVLRALAETTYLVMVLERLEFTMTAFIRAVGRRPGPGDVQAVTGVLRKLLDALDAAGLVYGDLSPDNIMLRPIAGGAAYDAGGAAYDAGAAAYDARGAAYDVALIDPQFVVPEPEFAAKLGAARSRAFDTTYLALKVQAIGMLDPAVAKFADAVCAGILGHVPAQKQTRHWLLHEAPVGLFMAYDALRATYKKTEAK